MFFQLREILRWLGVTVLELFLHCCSMLVFSVLLAIKIEYSGPDTATNDGDASRGGHDDLISDTHTVTTGSGPLSGPFGAGLSWFWVFSPLFISDILNAYFVTIVLIRTYIVGSYKSAFLRAIWSLFVISMLAVFKYLLACKLAGIANYDFSGIMIPIFILLQLVVLKACQMN